MTKLICEIVNYASGVFQERIESGYSLLGGLAWIAGIEIGVLVSPDILNIVLVPGLVLFELKTIFIFSLLGIKLIYKNG